MTAITVKVSRTRLIEALQKSLDAEKTKVDPNDRTQRDKDEATYKAAVAKWGKAVASLIAKSPTVLDVSSWNGRSVRFSTEGLDIPEYPQRPTTVVDYQDVGKINQISNAIKLLNLSDEEYVNANTYKSVVQYL